MPQSTNKPRGIHSTYKLKAKHGSEINICPSNSGTVVRGNEMLLVLLLTFIVLLFLIVCGGFYHGEIQQRFPRFEVLTVVNIVTLCPKARIVKSE
jgi:hypothetical protein